MIDLRRLVFLCILFLLVPLGCQQPQSGGGGTDWVQYAEDFATFQRVTLTEERKTWVANQATAEAMPEGEARDALIRLSKKNVENIDKWLGPISIAENSIKAAGGDREAAALAVKALGEAIGGSAFNDDPVRKSLILGTVQFAYTRLAPPPPD